jgi:hypothetical protein
MALYRAVQWVSLLPAMAGVTAYTRDGLCFSGSCYVSRRTGMTFNTVFSSEEVLSQKVVPE